MANYRSRRNYVFHSINNLTILIDGVHKVEGLDLFEAELDDDEVVLTKVADGLGIMSTNPSQSGTIKVNWLEASKTTDDVWAILDSGASFSISAIDSSADNFDVRGQYCRVQKRPVVSRGAEATVSEWVFITAYLDIKGGSYALATP